MSQLPHPLVSQPVNPARKRTGRRFASLLLAAGLTVGAMTALATSSASAASVCAPGTDTCVITDSVNTPLGPVAIAVSAENVVTVQLTPTAPRTLVLGIPFAIPPGPPGFPGYSRTSITTAGGVVNIDTFLAPPGTATWSGLAVVSIHPPGPCRVQTSGTTVVFTPIIPPGPPA
ncbi:hypothetical protein EAS64_30440 [Trebonia kvetii]|uniref:Uncharacterized protein n=1 Tax=Trebonia kvetii TaxID=2480626 RepID=A0A6P2BU69_9ACTN|nr:hypothetical protein [Trebonia kvetii]TVZ01776.1 hypothetical protein EAS64_30440 [Trebonia kvetii]